MNDFDVKYADLKGIHLVEANAGTGKTYTISSLFVRLIAETDYEIQKLLVLRIQMKSKNNLINHTNLPKLKISINCKIKYRL